MEREGGSSGEGGGSIAGIEADFFMDMGGGVLYKKTGRRWDFSALQGKEGRWGGGSGPYGSWEG